MFFAPAKSRLGAKIGNMGVLKTNDHFKIMIKMLNPNQEPVVSSKSPNQDLKDMGVLCTFKNKMEGQNSEHWCIEDH